MDPLAAVSLAGTVIQFLDFAGKIVSKSHELYTVQDGALAGNIELQDATDRLTTLSKTLGSASRKSRGSQSKSTASHAQSLKMIVQSCVAIAKELTEVLEGLKVRDNRKWTSVYQALRSVWKQDKIDGLAQNIKGYRDEMVIHLLAISTEDQAARIDQTLKEIRLLQTSNTVEHYKTQIEILEALKSRPSKEASPTDLDVLAGKLLNMSLQEETNKVEQAILDSLYLPQLQERYNRIANAHNKTFEWIFRSTKDGKPNKNNFSNWLRKGSEPYWIAGKPGSGKSTLMKFICQDERTRASLKTWAGSSELTTGSFYFWIAGLPIQKSIIGLLQSLFYEMLKENRSLILKLFPWRWRMHQSGGPSAQPWTENEFHDALKILKTQMTQTSKFCFFIDGLDEYEGDHEWLVNFAKELGSLPHIKLCISSRPWIVFEDAFADLSMLRVQDLTQRDIKEYAKAELQSHPRWPKLCTKEPDKAPKLIRDISTKSSGVFLWVYLVTRSLKDGLSNGDSISDLQRRVDGFPSDLEDYFMHILGRLEPFYLQQTKKFFRIALERPAPLLLTTYSFIDEDDPEFGQTASMTPFTREEIALRCEDTERRLKSRCKDLLEIYVENGSKRALMPSRGPVKQSMKGLPADAFNAEYITKVGFLHRTVRDFLNTPGAKIKLVATEEDNFNASHWLLQATLAQLKGMSRGSRQITRKDAFKEVISPAIWTLKWLGSSGIAPSDEYLEDLDRVSVLACGGVNHWTTLWMNGFNSILSFAVIFRFAKYVEMKLQLPELSSDNKLKAQLLGLATAPTAFGAYGLSIQEVSDTTMIQLLLRVGADPHREFRFRQRDGYQQRTTAYQIRPAAWKEFYERQPAKDIPKEVEEIRNLLSHGVLDESHSPREESSDHNGQSKEYIILSDAESDNEGSQTSMRDESPSPSSRNESPSSKGRASNTLVVQPSLKRPGDPLCKQEDSGESKRVRTESSVAGLIKSSVLRFH